MIPDYALQHPNPQELSWLGWDMAREALVDKKPTILPSTPEELLYWGASVVNSCKASEFEALKGMGLSTFEELYDSDCCGHPGWLLSLTCMLGCDPKAHVRAALLAAEAGIATDYDKKWWILGQQCMETSRSQSARRRAAYPLSTPLRNPARQAALAAAEVCGWLSGNEDPRRAFISARYSIEMSVDVLGPEHVMDIIRSQIYFDDLPLIALCKKP